MNRRAIAGERHQERADVRFLHAGFRAAHSENARLFKERRNRRNHLCRRVRILDLQRVIRRLHERHHRRVLVIQRTGERKLQIRRQGAVHLLEEIIRRHLARHRHIQNFLSARRPGGQR